MTFECLEDFLVSLGSPVPALGCHLVPMLACLLLLNLFSFTSKCCLLTICLIRAVYLSASVLFHWVGRKLLCRSGYELHRFLPSPSQFFIHSCCTYLLFNPICFVYYCIISMFSLLECITPVMVAIVPTSIVISSSNSALASCFTGY